jgi:hypothetical protein
MKCPVCDSRTEAFDLELLTRPVDPRLFRLAQLQRGGSPLSKLTGRNTGLENGSSRLTALSEEPRRSTRSGSSKPIFATKEQNESE